MKIDAQARYLESHEWARQEGELMVLGISDYAQSTLSDIVYLELPEVGDELTKGEQYAVVESVKAAADVYAPLSGEVVAINEALNDTPEQVNADAFGTGWLVKIKASDTTEWPELLDATAYEKIVEAEQAE